MVYFRNVSITGKALFIDIEIKSVLDIIEGFKSSDFDKFRLFYTV